MHWASICMCDFPPCLQFCQLTFHYYSQIPEGTNICKERFMLLTVLEVQSPRSDILLDWLLLSMANGSTYGGDMCKNSLILNQSREREGGHTAFYIVVP